MNACLLCCNCCHSTGIYGFEMKWLFECDVNVITSALTGTWVKIYSLTQCTSELSGIKQPLNVKLTLCIWLFRSSPQLHCHAKD